MGYNNISNLSAEICKFGTMSVGIHLPLHYNRKESTVQFCTASNNTLRFNYTASLRLNVYSAEWDRRNSLMLFPNELFKLKFMLDWMSNKIQTEKGIYGLKTYGEKQLYVANKDLHIAEKFVCGDILLLPAVIPTYIDNEENPGIQGIKLSFNGNFISVDLSLKDIESFTALLDKIDLYTYGTMLYTSYLTQKERVPEPAKYVNNAKKNIFNQEIKSSAETTAKIIKENNNDMEGL